MDNREAYSKIGKPFRNERKLGIWEEAHCLPMFVGARGRVRIVRYRM